MYIRLKKHMSDFTKQLLLENKTLKSELEFMKKIWHTVPCYEYDHIT